jgi:hypothetical protein
VIFVARPPYFLLNAWDIWQKCGNPHERQVWRNFWSDIVLYVKTNPGQAIFFENTIKKIGPQSRTFDYLKVPLPVAVKKLLKASAAFDRDFWLEAISEWAKIKVDLKIKTQTAILRNGRLIKDFLLAALQKTDNPRRLAAEVAGDCGLPKRYPQSDVLLMFCHIAAESLSAEIIKGEFDENMDEHFFQLAEDALAAMSSGVTEGSRQQPSGDAPAPAEAPKSFEVIWEEFLRDINNLDPLASDWSGMERYLGEAAKIAARKSEERAAILRRRALIDDFAAKTSHIVTAFSGQLSYIGFNLPAAEEAGRLPDSALETCIGALSGLTEALHSYQELSSEKKSDFVEDKKRVSLLLSTMTDIESCVEDIRKILTVALGGEKRETYASEQDEMLAARKMLIEKDTVPAAQNYSPTAATDADTQINLFSSKRN